MGLTAASESLAQNIVNLYYISDVAVALEACAQNWGQDVCHLSFLEARLLL